MAQSKSLAQEPQSIRLDAIRSDLDLQMREAGIDVGVVAEYAEAMTGGAEFPPILVFHDGNDYWPADGFHRIEASKKAGKASVLAEVRPGGKRDAMLAAVGVNAIHGLRRTNADKRRAVLAMLRDPEWSRMSDREIGKRCAVDHKTVGNIRREITGGEFPHPQPSPAPKVVRPPAGELPHPNGSGSMMARLLAKVDTADLVAECRRRGLEVSGDA